jgi:maleate cis-trans isomerase
VNGSNCLTSSKTEAKISGSNQIDTHRIALISPIQSFVNKNICSLWKNRGLQ